MLLKRLNRSICRLNFLLELKTKDRSNQKTHLKHLKLKKYIWCHNKSDDFTACLWSDQTKTCFSEAEELIEADISSSILKFSEGLLTAVECMKKTIVIGKERQQIWFDLECKQSRQVVRQYLRNYHNGNSDTDRASYTQKRNEYKELLRQKKAQHRRSVL